MAKGIVNINSSSSTATVHDIPVGGTSGQVLSKVDATDYNVQWSDVASGGTSGVISASSVVLTADTVLSANEVGKPLFVNTTSDVNITLPSGQDGSIILLKNKGTGKALIKGAVSGYVEPTEGLLAKYNFDSSYALDSMGTYSGTEYYMTYEDGQLGKCAVFNGTNSYIKIPRIIQDNFTIYFRFKSTQGIGTTTSWWSCAGLIDAEVSGTYIGDFGIALNSYGRIVGGIYSVSNLISNNEGYNDGNWHSVCMRREYVGGILNLTVDGVDKVNLTGTYTGSLTAPSYITFGKILDGTNYFQGSLDTVRFYSRAITDEELNTLNSENGAISEIIEQSSTYELETKESVTLCWNTQLNCWNVFSTSESSSTNTGNIKNYDITIPITGWVVNTGDYSYRFNISITDVLATDVLVFSADKDSHDIVSAASICPTVDSYDGGVTIYAKNIPTAEISASCTVISQGSLSGSIEINYVNPIDKPPTYPSIWDDEFNGITLDSKWVWINQGTATALVSNEIVNLYIPSNSSNSCRCLLQTAPSGYFTIISKINRCNTAVGENGGVVLYNSANGRLIMVGFHDDGSHCIKVHKYNSVTSWNSALYTRTWDASGIYIKVQYDSLGLKFWTSIDGRVWTTQPLYSESLNTFLVDITHIGIMGDSWSGVENNIIVDWFRITQQ